MNFKVPKSQARKNSEKRLIVSIIFTKNAGKIYPKVRFNTAISKRFGFKKLAFSCENNVVTIVAEPNEDIPTYKVVKCGNSVTAINNVDLARSILLELGIEIPKDKKPVYMELFAFGMYNGSAAFILEPVKQ